MEPYWMVFLISIPLIFSMMTFDLSETFSIEVVFAQSNGLTQTGGDDTGTTNAKESSSIQSSSDSSSFIISGGDAVGSGNQIMCNSSAGDKWKMGLGLKDSSGVCLERESRPNQPPPSDDDEDNTASLAVSIIIGCESRGGNPSDLAVCNFVLNNIEPSVFSFLISGNNPNPSNFPASEAGTEVSLGTGDYRIVENVDDEVIQSIKDDLNADEFGILPEFTGDCTQEFPSLNTATGSVKAGDSVECNVTNQFLVQGGTAPSS
jgi:hypothetical protein